MQCGDDIIFRYAYCHVWKISKRKIASDPRAIVLMIRIEKVSAMVVVARWRRVTAPQRWRTSTHWFNQSPIGTHYGFLIPLIGHSDPLRATRVPSFKQIEIYGLVMAVNVLTTSLARWSLKLESITAHWWSFPFASNRLALTWSHADNNNKDMLGGFFIDLHIYLFAKTCHKKRRPNDFQFPSIFLCSLFNCLLLEPRIYKYHDSCLVSAGGKICKDVLFVESMRFFRQRHSRFCLGFDSQRPPTWHHPLRFSLR